MKRYFGNFKTVEDVHREFNIPADSIIDKEILFAYYGYGSYCGAAIVLFKRSGTLHEVSSSHCSCNGLEGTWKPQAVTWDQLALRPQDYAYFEDDNEHEARKVLSEIVNRHAPRA